MQTWETLYNKYRPKNFQEFVGQKEIVTILENSLKKNYIHHGIIFTGIRGVGKTSLSLIFAAAMNCLKRNEKDTDISNIPCGECDNCKMCFSNSEDILQIDGATHTGVDSMRLIIEDTMFMPKYLKYKVIIIDEVHMLSKSAFNSILKTLENPPASVKFIFCTTEKHKILETIISRCLLLELKKIDPIDLNKRLKEIAKKEKIHIDDDALALIGLHSQGSLRDALSILENLYLLVLDKTITTHLIGEHLKLLHENNILEIYTHCLEGDWQKAIDAWHSYYYKGFSSLEFLKKLSVLLCDLLKAKLNTNNNPNGSHSNKAIEDLFVHIDISNSTIIGHWQICLYAIKNLYYGEEFLVDMVLIMITIMEENLSFEEMQTIFPGIKIVT